MLGIGWTEMLVVGVIALIVIGPKDLPVLMNKLGKAIASIRRMGSEFQREINRSAGLDQITDLRKALTDPLKQTAAEINREFNKTTATGVTPSGAIKPADPKIESVVDEIHTATGMTAPAAAAKTASAKTATAKTAGAKTASAKTKTPRKRKAPAAGTSASATPKPAAKARPAAKAKSAAEKPAAGDTAEKPATPRKRTPKPEA